MWRKSREDGNRSQDYMARALGVSKKTVQNWENGTSSPSQMMGFEWFKVLDLQPMPYYLELIFPQFNGISADDDDQRIEDALIMFVKALPPDQKRKMLYWAFGDHGSSPLCVLEMITAHLQSPLRSRLSVAQTVYTNYEVATARNNIRHPEHIQPNMELLAYAIESGKDAVKDGRESYTII